MPVRQAQGPPVGAVPPLLDAGHGGRGQVAEQVVGAAAAAGTAAAATALPARLAGALPAAAAARRRSSVGGRAKTSRTVSLNVRMLANPAANAMSPIGSVLVSISSRAVCARCARASASGPAPSSASSWRSICRTL